MNQVPYSIISKKEERIVEGKEGFGEATFLLTLLFISSQAILGGGGE